MNLRLRWESLKITPNTTFTSPLSQALAETYPTCAVAPKSKKNQAVVLVQIWVIFMHVNNSNIEYRYPDWIQALMCREWGLISNDHNDLTCNVANTWLHPEKETTRIQSTIKGEKSVFPKQDS